MGLAVAVIRQRASCRRQVKMDQGSESIRDHVFVVADSGPCALIPLLARKCGFTPFESIEVTRVLWHRRYRRLRINKASKETGLQDRPLSIL